MRLCSAARPGSGRASAPGGPGPRFPHRVPVTVAPGVHYLGIFRVPHLHFAPPGRAVRPGERGGARPSRDSVFYFGANIDACIA